MTTKTKPRTKTVRRQAHTVKAINTITSIEGKDGTILITLNGKELYSGTDWNEANRIMALNFCGLCRQETVGDAPHVFVPVEAETPVSPFGEPGSDDALEALLMNLGDDTNDYDSYADDTEAVA